VINAEIFAVILNRAKKADADALGRAWKIERLGFVTK
jgi:hypothetical protein